MSKYYVTKYALTGGIMLVDGERVGDRGEMLCRHQPGSLQQYFHGCGKEFHNTFDEAVARANEMRIAKIASMKKKLAKLEKMEFSEP